MLDFCVYWRKVVRRSEPSGLENGGMRHREGRGFAGWRMPEAERMGRKCCVPSWHERWVRQWSGGLQLACREIFLAESVSLLLASLGNLEVGGSRLVGDCNNIAPWTVQEGVTRICRLTVHT